MYILTVDFGSTFTKVTAVDGAAGKVLAGARAFTTIDTDVREGLAAASRELEKLCGKLEYSERLACSSAGGGLKMAAVGLVPGLTAKAARLAAASAGAKVVKTYSYELTARDREEIFGINPDIVLLSGGTDGGNQDVALFNAKALAEIDRPDLSVIVACNKSCAGGAAEIILRSGKTAIICGNVMPEFNRLEIAPAKAAIRDLFIQKIVIAKGLALAQEMMTARIEPTPLAVLGACENLAESGFGEFMAADIGGATTDVYSMASGAPSMPNILEKGLPEPFAKRSVEGDLGLRYGMASLVEAAGPERVAGELGISAAELGVWMDSCRDDPGLIPGPGSMGKKIDDKLAALAVELAVERHCGTLESVYTPFGESFIQTGKDLRGVNKLIGIGGPLINSESPETVLRAGLWSAAAPMSLRPEKPRLYLDKSYIFASMGLIGRARPELAARIMEREIVEI